MITHVEARIPLTIADMMGVALRAFSRHTDDETFHREAVQAADALGAMVRDAYKANREEEIEAIKDATLAAIATRQAGGTTLGSGH